MSIEHSPARQNRKVSSVRPAIFDRVDAAKFCGVSVQTLDRYRASESFKFPPALDLGPRRVGWLRDDLIDWLHSRPRVGIRPRDDL